jgi:hypothetical protein
MDFGCIGTTARLPMLSCQLAKLLHSVGASRATLLLSARPLSVRCATSLPVCRVFPHLKRPPLSAAGPRKMVETGRSIPRASRGYFGYGIPHTVGNPFSSDGLAQIPAKRLARPTPTTCRILGTRPEACDYVHVGYPTGAGHRA